MFKMNTDKKNEKLELEINDNFRYFKPDLELKRLRLQKEAKFETRLFYKTNNN